MPLVSRFQGLHRMDRLSALAKVRGLGRFARRESVVCSTAFKPILLKRDYVFRVL